MGLAIGSVGWGYGETRDRIAFASDRDGNWEIHVMDADGDNKVNLTQHPHISAPR